MAYTVKGRNSMPIPAEPAVLCCYVPNSAAETNILVYVPWKNCQLTYAYTVVVTAIDGTGDMVMDLQLDSTSGSDMYSITVAASSAVGTIDEATVDTEAATRKLDRDDTSRDAIIIEVDGSSGATGAVMLYMYFEADYEV